LGNEGVSLVAEALKREPNLTFVNFQGNQIGDEGATALAEAMKVCVDSTIVPCTSILIVYCIAGQQITAWYLAV
jgi:Ran GTPase-activating protein (RanGAP) involved in mRNA processing and transport